ncbi:MAG: hypothetical protein A2Y38_23410 [Spirochaetes bacterium GWB1_59_5]|nr:MAG: hypothetical protein A2Y38_23410 [Spirochaetes bacterium GWB1_59_5]
MSKLVLGDLHVGDGRAADLPLLAFLRAHEQVEELILNGDVLDLFWTEGVLTPDMLLLLNQLRRFQRVTWIVGNHDKPVLQHLSLLPPCVHLVPEGVYPLRDHGLDFTILHGHQADTLVVKHPWVARQLVRLHAWLYHCFGWDVQAWARSFASAQRALERQEESIRTDPRYKADIIISGHTHRPHQEGTYFNSGDWLCHRTYIEIDAGVVRLREA